MSVIGFNVGSTISLGDMSLAIDYIIDKESFGPDLQEDNQSISGMEDKTSNLLAENNGNELVTELNEDTTYEMDLEDFESQGIDIEEDLEIEDIEVDEEEIFEEIDDSEIFGDNEIEGDNEGLFEDINEADIDDILVNTRELAPNKVDNNRTEKDKINNTETSNEDDEFDLSDIEDFEDDTIEIAKPLPSVNKPTVTKQEDIINKNETPKTINQQYNKTMELDEKEKELKKRLEKASRKKEEELKKRLEEATKSKEEAKKREIQRLEAEVLRAEQEAALLESKKRLNENNNKNISNQNRQIIQTRATNQTNAPVNKGIESQASRALDVKSNNSAQYYSDMDIDALYKEVKLYMQKKGVSKAIIDKKELEIKFGALNIKKLILKSYLISIGKGVTVGK